MNKVYMLVSIDCDFSLYIHGAYATEELAKAAGFDLQNANNDQYRGERFEVKEYILNGGM